MEVNIRALALEIICECLENDGFCNVLLKQVLDKYSYLERRDRGFLTRLTMGTIERSIALDAVIMQFTDVKVRKMKPVIRNILRMSAYQIYEMDTKSYSICNEAVELVKLNKQKSFTGFVNGVLRSMIRHKEDFDKTPVEAPVYAFMKYRQMFPKLTLNEAASLPPVIFMKLRKQYGDDAYKIMNAFYEHADYKVNLHLLGEHGDLNPEKLNEYINEGLLTKHPYEDRTGNDLCFLTDSFDIVKETPLFTDGHMIVQDFSSSFVGRLFEVKDNEKVLDLCAAPGGKSLHVADRIFKRGGTVLSCDISEEKLGRIEENIARCHMSNMSTYLWDATLENPSFKDQYDVVICDAPCSGLGIIGNKPDIKLRIMKTGEQSFDEIVLLQREILKNACKYVKAGGTLLYSTCTLNQDENEKQVQFLVSELGMEVIPFTDLIPEKIKETNKGVSPYGLTFLPGIHNTEGFFVSVLKKPEEP